MSPLAPTEGSLACSTPPSERKGSARVVQKARETPDRPLAPRGSSGALPATSHTPRVGKTRPKRAPSPLRSRGSKAGPLWSRQPPQDDRVRDNYGRARTWPRPRQAIAWDALSRVRDQQEFSKGDPTVGRTVPLGPIERLWHPLEKPSGTFLEHVSGPLADPYRMGHGPPLGLTR